MFDLPTKEKEDRLSYAKFRKWLIQNGYDMLQYSIYCRICNCADSANLHMNKLTPNIPKNGSVRSLIVTDMQYAKMKVHRGTKTVREERLGSDQISFF